MVAPPAPGVGLQFDGLLRRVHDVILARRGDVVGVVDPGVVAVLEPEKSTETPPDHWTPVAAPAGA